MTHRDLMSAKYSRSSATKLHSLLNKLLYLRCKLDEETRRLQTNAQQISDKSRQHNPNDGIASTKKSKKTHTNNNSCCSRCKLCRESLLSSSNNDKCFSKCSRLNYYLYECTLKFFINDYMLSNLLLLIFVSTLFYLYRNQDAE